MAAEQGLRRGRFEELSEGECRELLATQHVGRIGLESSEGPLVLPLNFVVHDGDIVFRTSPYNLVAATAPGKQVAFEVDELDEFLQAGWSVLAVGHAEVVDVDELPEEWSARPQPWAEGTRPFYVRIRIARVTGRRVHPA